MEVKESNKYDDYTWVIKVIQSSTTINHIVASIQLINLFDNKHNDQNLYDNLRHCKRNQEHIIRYK